MSRTEDATQHHRPSAPAPAAHSPTDDDYRRLLAFRTGLRRFLQWSEQQAIDAGLTAAQHQLLLAVRGLDGDRSPTMGEIRDALLLKHHSVVGLVDRAEAIGLVRRRRDPDDKRVVRVQLTPKGTRVLEHLAAQHLAELEQLAPALRALIRDAATPAGGGVRGPG